MAEQGSTEDKEAKTEDPTPKRLEEALEKGQVINSKEVTTFLIILTCTLLITWVLPANMRTLVRYLASLIEQSWQVDISKMTLADLFHQSIMVILLLVGPIFLGVMIASILSAFIQQGQFIWSTKQITPDLSKISPLQGFKRLFSSKNLVELLKNIIKISVIGGMIYWIILADLKELALYPTFSLQAILVKMQSLVQHIMICIAIITAVIALLDYSYQRYQYFASLKMSRKELKDEFKQLEGNPEVKGKIRSLQRDIAQQRMMDSIPNATVVITNPEHYAVALQYDPKRIKVPLVTAKGVDYLAKRIKEIAAQHKIPIVANPTVARLLYKEVEVGEIIKTQHYEVVAKIIGYIYQLKKRSSR